jgi:hypothetical protein
MRCRTRYQRIQDCCTTGGAWNRVLLPLMVVGRFAISFDTGFGGPTLNDSTDSGLPTHGTDKKFV